MSDSKVIGVIPARWGSSRFPGKPLALILGTSLIQRTYNNTLKAKRLDKVVIATDDQRIYDHVAAFSGDVVLTSTTCMTGTDRVHEVITQTFPHAEVVVNIQGDEPCLTPLVIDTLVDKLEKTEGAVMTTPVTKITDDQDVKDHSVVKCVFDGSGRALYFSRAPIPFPQNVEKRQTYYRHLGVYCFKRSFLETYHELPIGSLQNIEDLEQLKVLESGYPIHVCVVEDKSVGVDTPEDIERVEEILCQKSESTFSSPVG